MGELAADVARDRRRGHGERGALRRGGRGLQTVALGGGCFQNARLLTSLRARLEAMKFRVLVPKALPANDGGVSYGQAAVAAARLAAGQRGTAKRLTEASPMCLGIPGRIIELHRDRGLAMGMVDFGGVRRDVCLAYVQDEVEIGDYVIVHVGFAISKVDEAEAKRTFEALREMSQLEELDFLEQAIPPGVIGEGARP